MAKAGEQRRAIEDERRQYTKFHDYQSDLCIQNLHNSQVKIIYSTQNMLGDVVAWLPTNRIVLESLMPNDSDIVNISIITLEGKCLQHFQYVTPYVCTDFSGYIFAIHGDKSSKGKFYDFGNNNTYDVTTNDINYSWICYSNKNIFLYGLCDLNPPV